MLQVGVRQIGEVLLLNKNIVFTFFTVNVT